MSTVIVTADIVGSTEAKAKYDQATAARKIRAALESIRNDLCKVDENLHCPAPYAGDQILLIGGSEPTEIYFAACAHQAIFRSRHYNRFALKITIGIGDYEIVNADDGHTSYHGTDLDTLYRINDWCPPGRVLVTQSMYSVLQEAGYGNRFYEVRETLKGLGSTVFYESNGEYEIPSKLRQPYRARMGWRYRWIPHGRLEWTASLSVVGVFMSLLMGAVIIWMLSRLGWLIGP